VHLTGREAGMKGPIDRAQPGAARRRRRIAMMGLLVGGAAAAAIAFGGARALATSGTGAVSNYVARGPVSQSVVIGVPRTATATKKVRVRVGRKVVTRRVRFTYQTVTPLMTCSTSTACDTAYQQLTIAPGGYTGWHTHPGPTFVAVAQGEGTLYHGMSGCPATKYGVGAGFMQPPTEVHNMRNEGSTPLVLWAFYALPPGTSNAAIRVDQPQPTECPNIP
jgi:mannose-6-phosphate isomerase-like protein (cupin superfamily)